MPTISLSNFNGMTEVTSTSIAFTHSPDALAAAFYVRKLDLSVYSPENSQIGFCSGCSSLNQGRAVSDAFSGITYLMFRAALNSVLSKRYPGMHTPHEPALNVEFVTAPLFFNETTTTPAPTTTTTTMPSTYTTTTTPAPSGNNNNNQNDASFITVGTGVMIVIAIIQFSCSNAVFVADD